MSENGRSWEQITAWRDITGLVESVTIANAPKNNMPAIPKIVNVIFNPPTTIILWADGTKTVVKCHEEEFSEEHGFAMAVIRKLFGNRSKYLKVIEQANRQEPKEKKVK